MSTKPILLDATGQSILTEAQAITASLGSIAEQNPFGQLSSIKSKLIKAKHYNNILTSNKYIKYSDGTSGDLTGANFVEAPVFPGMMVWYNATIGSPDARGAAFYDTNGVYLTGYQMLTEAQAIVVPEGAALFRATVESADDIILSDYNGAVGNVPGTVASKLFENLGGVALPLSSGKRYNTSGSTIPTTAISVSGYYCSRCACEAGDVFSINAYYDGNSNTRLYAFYNADGDKIADSGATSGLHVWEQVVAPSGSKTAIFNGKTSAGNIDRVVFAKGKFLPHTIDGLISIDNSLITATNGLHHDIYGDAPVDVLDGLIAYADKTSGGITYTKNTAGTVITASGTRSGTSFAKIINGSVSSLPVGITAGKSYNIDFTSSSEYLGVYFNYYKNGAEHDYEAVMTSKTVTIPDWATGLEIRFQVFNGWPENGSGTITMPKLYTIPDDRGLAGDVEDLQKAVFGSVPDSPLAVIRHDPGMASIFHTVGCIGDSLSSGESAYKENGVTGYIDMYEFSWGQCLARMTGNTYYNFSKGGLTTKTWLTTEAGSGFGPSGLHAFDGDHDCTAYFIALGQNDKNVSMTVGTTADINMEDYTQNADTYCGNYGKIIQMVKENTPKAPIFCFTDPCPVSGDLSYNAAVREIVALFDNVYLLDMYAYAYDLYNSGYIGQQKRSGHFNAVGYQEMAFVIATYVDSIVRSNVLAFQQVEFINTGYAWS